MMRGGGVCKVVHGSLFTHFFCELLSLYHCLISWVREASLEFFCLYLDIVKNALIPTPLPVFLDTNEALFF